MVLTYNSITNPPASRRNASCKPARNRCPLLEACHAWLHHRPIATLAREMRRSAEHRVSIAMAHRATPTRRLSVAGFAAVVAAHVLLAVLLLRAESWVPPAAERVLAVSLLSDVAPAPTRPERTPNAAPPRPRTIETPPPAQIAGPAEVVAATPFEAPRPPAPAPVAAAPVAAAPAPPTDKTPAAPPPASSPAPASPPAPAVTPARFDADYLDNPKPGYPPVSRRLGEEGRVVLRVRVDSAGLAVEAQVHASSGFDRLDSAALSTVRRWKFVPARRGSEAVAATVLVPITFSLKG
jgi:protein TonB